MSTTTSEPVLPRALRVDWVSLVVLGVGVVAASFSAILIRYARDAEPLAIFHDRLSRVGWGGIAAAMAGTALIGGGDLGGSSLRGDLLALAGGAAAAGYLLGTQAARRTLGILEFATITYAIAAALLLVACIGAGAPLSGYSAKTWWAITGIVIGPQIIGHTLINFVLKDIDATTVSVAVMAEPIIAIALAFALFDETPSWLVYPGGAAILAGIYLVSRVRRPPALIVE